jgi:O-antigen ligase
MAFASVALGRDSAEKRGAAYVKARFAAVLPGLVAVWIFAGGFVLIEPSPYELMFALVLPVALLSGMWLYRGTLNILNLLVVFLPFATIAAFQARHFTLTETLIYLLVTVFLWLTTYFVANFVAADPKARVTLIMKSYTSVAVLVALIGILAYLGLLPARDLFLRYGRAKATFQDPNVFAPFLILPAIFAAQKMFLAKGWGAFLAAIVFAILFVGIFVSFSRGGWGHLAASSLLSFFLVFALEAKARDKVRMLLIALGGVALLILVLAALLSIDSVRELFLIRFSIAENYDTGSTGRFARQFYAFDLILSHPWGLGPKEFTALRIIEEPHNTYFNDLLIYGWGGGLACIALILMTIWRGIRHLAIPSPNRLMLIALVATYIPMMIEAGIIDTDHWRHFYLVTGLIWGVTANYPRLKRKRTGVSAAGSNQRLAEPL